MKKELAFVLTKEYKLDGKGDKKKDRVEKEVIQFVDKHKDDWTK